MSAARADRRWRSRRTCYTAADSSGLRRVLHPIAKLSVTAQPRSALFGLAAIAAVALFLVVWPHNYPAKDWLIWDYLQIWGWAGLFCAVNLCHGYFWLERVFEVKDRPLLETLVLALAVGIAGYGIVFHIAGALGVLRQVVPIAYPLAAIALGVRPLLLRLLAEQARPPPETPPYSLPVRTIINLARAAGVAVVVLIYLTVMTPDAIGYDGEWEHQVIAQEYARNGRIVAFPADWVKNHPQLASVVYAWGYLGPGFQDPQRWAAALHIEFVLFLWTLAGVTAAVQSVLHDERLPGVWAGFFLFTALFVNDCNLQGSADHVLAFFAAPAYLAALRAGRSLAVRDVALTGIIVGTGMHIKYQGMFLGGAVAVPLTLGWLAALHQCLRNRPGALSYGRLACLPLVAAGAALLASSPHFIRNAWFHGNPFYPFMQHVFASYPTVPHANYWVNHVYAEWHFRPHGSFSERARSSLEVLVTFSWRPHYSYWSRNVPIFGALFTLCTPLALLLPAPRQRVWMTVFAGMVAITMWAATYRIDRNLQAIVPLLAVATLAVIIRGYRLGRLARAGLIPLVLVHVLWSADLVAITNSHLFHSALALIRAGYDGQRGDAAWAGFRRPQRDIDAALPKNAKLLMHYHALSLGINRPILFDWVGYQGTFNLLGISSPVQLWQAYRNEGVTHVLWAPGGGASATRGEDVVFAMLMAHAGEGRRFGNFSLHELPGRPPLDPGQVNVLALGMPGYADGLYRVQDMATHEGLPDHIRFYPAPAEPLPADEEGRRDLLAKSSAVYTGPRGVPAPRSKHGPAPQPLSHFIDQSFRPAASHDRGLTVYLRQP